MCRVRGVCVCGGVWVIIISGRVCRFLGCRVTLRQGGLRF